MQSLNSAETEEQQPNWGDVHEWGELYDLEADPQVKKSHPTERRKKKQFYILNTCIVFEQNLHQENVNLYRDHDYLDLKVQMRKLLHAGWYDHN